MTATENLLQSELALAWRAVQQMDISVALVHAQKAAAIAPESAEVSHILGVIAGRDARYDIALPLLHKALSIAPTQKRYLDLAQLLLLSGKPQEAQVPLAQAIAEFGISHEIYGLQAAILVASNDFAGAELKATAAAKDSIAWDTTVAFCKLITNDVVQGLQWLTSRPENLSSEGRCPALYFSKPADLYLKNEEGPGDTLFHLRYAKFMSDKGFKLHIKTDKKTKSLLNSTGLFASVKEELMVPRDAMWLNMGDLPLAAMQLGAEIHSPAIALTVDAQRKNKVLDKLAAFGPPPYVAVTWRAGARGKNLQAGLRKYNKHIDPASLGARLKNIACTLVSVQRLPEPEELAALELAAGRQVLNLATYNDQLHDMLALLSCLDCYIAVPNTNVHLAQSLNLPVFALINQPYQDWRWQSQGDSPWYPSAKVFRQSIEGDWSTALAALGEMLLARFKTTTTVETLPALTTATSSATQPASTGSVPEQAVTHRADSLEASVIQQGWRALQAHQIAEAIQAAQSLLKNNPQHVEALHLLGWAAHLDRKHEIAAEILKQATVYAPDYAPLLANLVKVLTHIQQLDEAYALLNAFLDKHEADPSLLAASAALHQARGHTQQAILDYQRYLQLRPDNLDMQAYLALLLLKSGQVYEGFKANTARKGIRLDGRGMGMVCPILQGDIAQLRILVKHDKGLGDELTFLRYLPWLSATGARVTYWAGAKLAPLLARHRQLLDATILAGDTPPPPDEGFDLAIWVDDLPLAVSHYDAPLIAPTLTLSAEPARVATWSAWLKTQGPAPYIGFNWRAGVKADSQGATMGRLSKEIPADLLANALGKLNGTLVSLQRNVTQAELNQFAEHSGKKIADASALSDDLEDLLALLSLLDANVGVSNTNMHLRAALGMGSDVLVQHPDGDWRWGEQDTSPWFPASRIYRQSTNSDWQPALVALCHTLAQQFGEAQADVGLNDISSSTIASQPNTSPLSSPIMHSAEGKTAPSSGLSKHIVWVTAGEINQHNAQPSSQLVSAVERVIAPAQGLAAFGWQSRFVHETMAEIMGGWQGLPPQAGDVVVFSKVVTQHALTMARDAATRGAYVVVDVFNDFSQQAAREQHQQALLALAHAVVSVRKLTEKWQQAQRPIDAYIENIESALPSSDKEHICRQWHELLSNLPEKNTPIQNRPYAQKRVLVGMLYSGEQEYAQAVQALQAQTHHNFTLIEFKDLPNKQAHDALYAAFMQHASEFDYFLKLDADMVFAHENVLTEMVETMATNDLAHLFAYVHDCPSELMIPGIQMFRADTQWQGSEELLNVDYLPKLFGESATQVDKRWILHMPAPAQLQLFRYGIHKALKSLQRGHHEKSQKKTILHISILTGMYRQLANKPDNIWALMGATLVFNNLFKGIEYNGSQMQQHFESLKQAEAYHQLLQQTKLFWNSEVQVMYQWLDLLQASQEDQPSQSSTRSETLPAPKTEIAKSTRTLYWVTAGKLETGAGYVYSSLASTRYRVLLPAANLGPLGWQSQIIHEKDLATHGWQQLPLKPDDIVIVSKSHCPDILPAVKQAKETGCTIITDFCDNHFDRPDEVGQHQHDLLKIADHIVTTTPELATTISALSPTPVTVITDCFEGNKHAPRFQPSQVLKILWFGSHTNLDTLKSVYPQLVAYAEKRPLALELVTNLENGEQVASELTQGGLTVSYTAWGQHAIKAALDRCDLVIIPTVESEQKAGKSPNRLVEALWAGRYVIAGALPAYQALSDFASVGEELSDALDWAIAHPEQITAKIAAGQTYIAQHHTPKLIGKYWHAVLSEVDQQCRVKTELKKTVSHASQSINIKENLSKAIVVISHFNQRSTTDLAALLKSIDMYEPGIAIEVAIVVNDVTSRKLEIQSTRYPTHIFYRENTGMNIGAWDYGWRQFPNESVFIFMQDECRVIKADWALAMASLLADKTVGLVGESLNAKWDSAWAELAQNQSYANRVHDYHAIFKKWAVPAGESGKHLRSLVWAAKLKTLQSINGFNVGNNHDECIAAEIAASKKVEALGLRIAQVSEKLPFQFVAHTEWSSQQKKLTRLEFDASFEYGKPYLLEHKHYTVKPRHDLFAMIDNAPQSICEIGCADGTNLITLANQFRQQGIEPSLVGVDIAKVDNDAAYQHFSFHHQTAESFIDTWQGSSFDLVIFSDVIEHLYNPWHFMEKIKRLLNPGARILMSVPNIQNLNYLNATVTGAFHYQDSGLFDVTHIRFFSVETLTNMLEYAGFRLIAQDFRPDASLADLRHKTLKALSNQDETIITIGNFKISINRTNVERYFSQQILISCTPI